MRLIHHTFKEYGFCAFSSNFFDDKLAIVNASLRGEVRGIALPLLLDLAREPVFLHDNSVPSLDNLFDPGLRPTKHFR